MLKETPGPYPMISFEACTAAFREDAEQLDKERKVDELCSQEADILGVWGKK